MPIKIEITDIPQITVPGATDLVLVVSGGLARLMPEGALPNNGIFADASNNLYRVSIINLGGVITYGQPELIAAAEAAGLVCTKLADSDGNYYTVQVVVMDGVPTLGKPVRIE